MALPDVDTSVGHSFGLEFDGVVIKQITEVSGLQIDQASRLPGRLKAGEVTLTRGLTGDNSFEKWVKASRFGKAPDARKGGAIIVYDYEGAAIKRYRLVDARLKTVERGTRKAGDANALTERLIVTHQGSKAE